MPPRSRLGWASLAALLAGLACAIGWRYHKPERAGPMGGFRCPTCGKVGADLDEFVKGQDAVGYVDDGRVIFDREPYQWTRDRTGGGE